MPILEAAAEADRVMASPNDVRVEAVPPEDAVGMAAPAAFASGATATVTASEAGEDDKVDGAAEGAAATSRAFTAAALSGPDITSTRPDSEASSSKYLRAYAAVERIQ